MARKLFSIVCLAGGILLMLAGLSVAPAPGVASAMPALQPSPRPPVSPVEDSGPKATEVIATARVTGTIIDLTTGAPVPNVLVDVGGVTVISDENGNYERAGLVSGYYKVELMLEASRGAAAQAPQEVAVGQGDTVVVHLFFYSPTPVPAPTAAPTATPTIAPALAGGAPPDLPETSIERRPARPAQPAAAKPPHLPVTAAAAAQLPQLWIMAGAAFVLLGGVLLLLPAGRRSRKRRASPVDHTALLDRLLAHDVAPAPRSPERVLDDLLEQDVRS